MPKKQPTEIQQKDDGQATQCPFSKTEISPERFQEIYDKEMETRNWIAELKRGIPD